MNRHQRIQLREQLRIILMHHDMHKARKCEWTEGEHSNINRKQFCNIYVLIII